MTGKIERAITHTVRRMQQGGTKVAVNTADVVSEVYGHAEPTRGQLAAVLHEMQSFVRKHQTYVLAGGQGPSRLSIVMADEIHSAAARQAAPCPRWRCAVTMVPGVGTQGSLAAPP